MNQARSTLIVLAEHKDLVYDKTGLSLITSSIRRFPPGGLDLKIHHANLLQSILAKIEANHAGVNDALMLNYQGFIAETNATHLFIVHNSIVYTPHLHACPEGIMLSTVLNIRQQHNIDYEVKNISLTKAYRADEMLCTGTMGELASIINLDGRNIGNGVQPITKKLSAWYTQMNSNNVCRCYTMRKL